MNEHFLTYEQSLTVKELGFDEPCLKMSEHRKLCPEQEKPNGCQLHNLHCGYPYCTIDSTITPIPLPLKSQFFKWVREKYNMCSWIYTSNNIEYYSTILRDGRMVVSHELSDTYEQAEDACINKIIELLKEKI